MVQDCGIVFKIIFDFLGIDLFLGANIIMLIIAISYRNKIKRWKTISDMQKFSIVTAISITVLFTLMSILSYLNIIDF